MRILPLSVMAATTFFAASFLPAQQPVVPNTTLAIEKAANTSASPSFNGMSNGNPGHANVSKQDIHTLLYPGATTNIFAHVVGWFGQTSHYNVGYNSSSSAQVHAQVSDMMSRGITGVVLDWRGPNNLQDSTAAALRSEVDARGGAFQFAIMEDGGALSACYKTSGCDVTQKLINDLNYAYVKYVACGAVGNPVLMPQNTAGFTAPLSAGAFAWVQPSLVTTTDPMSLNYLGDFIWNANNYPAKTPFLTTYKGFDDSYASWGSHRKVNQSCGQTWLQTFATINRSYNTSHPLPFLQLVTWDDYEEGTPLETGIDNCVAVSGSVSGGTLSWNIGAGQENTIQYYSIYISTDGSHLMKITDVNAGQHSLNIASYNFVHGSYSVFIKAWGQPSIINKISPAIPAVL